MKYLFIAFFIISQFNNLYAQRVAYIDMDMILTSVDDYKQAQTDLDQLAEKWRQEIAREYDKIESMYREYQTREPLLSDEMKKTKQNEIVAKEKEIRDLNKRRFGPDGELFQKRKSLVKPIQEKVYGVIQKLAKERKYDFVFTAPDGSTLIYADESKDLTDEVIRRLKL